VEVTDGCGVGHPPTPLFFGSFFVLTDFASRTVDLHSGDAIAARRMKLDL